MRIVSFADETTFLRPLLVMTSTAAIHGGSNGHRASLIHYYSGTTSERGAVGGDIA